MALFSAAKSYESIVAPLKKMVKDLTTYVEEQKTKITNMESEKAKIEENISLSQGEIKKSQFTTSKINELLGADLDSVADTPDQ